MNDRECAERKRLVEAPVERNQWRQGPGYQRCLPLTGSCGAWRIPAVAELRRS